MSYNLDFKYCGKMSSITILLGFDNIFIIPYSINLVSYLFLFDDDVYGYSCALFYRNYMIKEVYYYFN